MFNLDTVKTYLVDAGSGKAKYVLMDMVSPVGMNGGIPLLARVFDISSCKTDLELYHFINETMEKNGANAIAFYTVNDKHLRCGLLALT